MTKNVALRSRGANEKLCGQSTGYRPRVNGKVWLEFFLEADSQILQKYTIFSL